MLKQLVNTQEEMDQSATTTVNMWPLSQIKRSKEQMRKKFDPDALNALAKSIAKHGLLQPLVIQSIGSAAGRLVAGERRYRACQIAKLVEVPVIIRDVEDNDESLVLGLIENTQRVDLTAIELAWACQELKRSHEAKTGKKMTDEQIAEIIGKSRPVVTNTLRLLALPGSVQEMILDGELSAGQANELLTLKMHPAEMVRLAKDCIGSEWSVLELRRNAAYTLARLEPEKAPEPSQSGHPDEWADPLLGKALAQQPDNSEMAPAQPSQGAQGATGASTTRQPSQGAQGATGASTTRQPSQGAQGATGASTTRQPSQGAQGAQGATGASTTRQPSQDATGASTTRQPSQDAQNGAQGANRSLPTFEEVFGMTEDEHRQTYECPEQPQEYSKPEPGDTTALAFHDGQVLIQLGALDIDVSNVKAKYKKFHIVLSVNLVEENGAISFDEIIIGEDGT